MSYRGYLAKQLEIGGMDAYDSCLRSLFSIPPPPPRSLPRTRQVLGLKGFTNSHSTGALAASGVTVQVLEALQTAMSVPVSFAVQVLSKTWFNIYYTVVVLNP